MKYLQSYASYSAKGMIYERKGGKLKAVIPDKHLSSSATNDIMYYFRIKESIFN